MSIHYTISAEDPAIAEIALDQPATLNALAEEDVAELRRAVRQATDDAEARRIGALVLRGEGRGFCSGRDISGVDPATDDAEHYLGELITPLLRELSDVPVPTFAAVHGVCLGVGLGFVLACDVAYVAEDARFGSPFARLGAALDSGGHHLFVTRLGAQRAMDLILTGDFLSGSEAVAAGMFARALPSSSLLEVTRENARRVAQGAPLAARAARGLVREVRDERLGLWETIARENAVQGELCNTADYREGFAAFQEKRPPIFEGK